MIEKFADKYLTDYAKNITKKDEMGKKFKRGLE